MDQRSTAHIASDDSRTEDTTGAVWTGFESVSKSSTDDLRRLITPPSKIGLVGIHKQYRQAGVNAGSCLNTAISHCSATGTRECSRLAECLKQASSLMSVPECFRNKFLGNKHVCSPLTSLTNTFLQSSAVQACWTEPELYPAR